MKEKKENEKENCISIISLCTWNVPGDRMWKQCKGCRNDKDGRWKNSVGSSGIPGEKQQVNVFQDIVDAFNESQDKYEVKTTTQADYTETYEKLQAGIAGKKAPDMALLDTDKSRNLSEKNLVADINEYVEKDEFL